MTLTEIFNVISNVISVTPMNRALQRIDDDKSQNFENYIFSAAVFMRLFAQIYADEHRDYI